MIRIKGHISCVNSMGFIISDDSASAFAYYSSYDEAMTGMSVRIAKEFGLLCSGGSDFHGATKPGVKLGVGNGNLRVSFENYLSLKNICVNR